MNRTWQLVIHEPSMRALLAANSTKRTQLFRIFDELLADPLRKGHYEETDLEGRTVQVMVSASWTITYWADFFSKELRILKAEQNRNVLPRRKG